MKKYRLYLLLVGLIVSFVLASYGVPAATSKAPPGVISCFTWSSGSQSYFVSAGMSEVVGKYSPVKIAVEPTAGPPAWLPLLRKKQGDMGVMTILDAYDSYYGIGIQKHGPQPIRLLLTSYSSQHMIYARPDRGINSIPDLRGKKVGIDTPPSEIQSIVAPLTLEAFGLRSNKEYVGLSHGVVSEKKEALIEGRIDAYYYTFPGTHALEVKRAVGLVAIPIPPKSVEYVKEKTGYPVFSGKIKPKLLKEYGIPEGATTMSYSVCFVVREDLPEDMVYQILKALYGHFDEFARMHVRSAETTLERAVSNPPIPFHEGAIRYYKESGVWSSDLENMQKKMLAKPRGK